MYVYIYIYVFPIFPKVFSLEARLVEQERKRMEAVAAEERAELETEEQRKKVANSKDGTKRQSTRRDQ